MVRWIFPGLLALGLTAAPFAARACGPEVVVSFYESGPDVFVIENKSTEPWTLVSLEISLTGSAGRLVFDTDFGGEGASEPQQFEPVDGEVGLAALPKVADGAEHLSLAFHNFTPGRRFIFAIDLDDRLASSPGGQAVIDDGEIQGATVRGGLIHPGAGQGPAHGTFGTDGKAHLRGATCA